MLTLLLRPLRLLAQALTANDSPRQIAWGLVLGMIVGLIPKGNLIAISLGILLCSLQVNLSAGMLAAGVFSLLGMALDPIAHRIGAGVLLWEAARPLWTWTYQKPLGPWLGFNNTVVMGQLVLGLYLAYPTYLVGRYLGVKIQPRVKKWLMGYRVIRWLRGAELGATWGVSS